MTFNQVIRRIKTLALDHKQIRNFQQGLVQDFLTDKTTLYPSCFLQSSGGTLSTSGKALTLGFRMFLCDLVNVSEDTKTNELDVQSDMLLVMMDLIAQVNFPAWTDWLLSTDNQVQLFVEDNGDMYAGVYIDFQLRTMFTQNVCQVPSVFDDYDPIDTTMKDMFDYTYVATGTEGTTITIDVLKGKKILLITRDSAILYLVSNLPDTTQFTFDGTDIEVSTNLIAGNKFLILYRNY